VLYQFSIRCPEDQVYNSTMSKLCTVINVCQEKLLLLPLNSTQSALSFGLGEINVNDSGKLDNKLNFTQLILQRCIYFHDIYKNKLYILINK